MLVKKIQARVLALALLSLILASIACASASPAPSDSFGPDQKSAILVYFKVDATNAQINAFLDNVIGIPGKQPGEHDLLPGMGGINALACVQDHCGYSIDFFSTATQDERDTVKTRILASPIVFKMLENAIPSQVTSLDQP